MYRFHEKLDLGKLGKKGISFSPRRNLFVNIKEVIEEFDFEFGENDKEVWEKYDLIYRTLCGILYNFVPESGHPGGSISSGRFVAGLVFHTMDYDFSDPNRKDADILSYAAGHKALGLYATWALRNEVVRIFNKELLPGEKFQLRLEDLLGFRRNPTQNTPLFKKFNAKPLDGHPTPATPFIKISTGASGVGVGTSFGLALGALDIFREDPPFVHVVEGEGGMTPGRVHEALAAAASAQIWNIVMHVDWNQASIDSNNVCRDGDKPGEYVQWNPIELGYLHEWNVVFVEEGRNFKHILAAQNVGVELSRLTKLPTMIVYRTIKGWTYGIEGRKSHGAGHKFCSEGYYNFLKMFEEAFKVEFPRFKGEVTPENIERYFYDSLMVIREVMERERDVCESLGRGIMEAKERLNSRKRTPHEQRPQIGLLYNSQEIKAEVIPEELKLKPDTETTLRGHLGSVLNYLNRLTKGAFIACAADLLDSTSISITGKGFSEGFYNAVSNPNSRLIPIGGICEDAMGAFMSGLSAYGFHIGVSSSYAAFIAPLEHIAARLHGIGQQAKREIVNEPYNTWIMVNAHAGIKTGEDGPTHADPQALQLLQENFPKGVLITLTPWDPQELWPLIVEGLKKRPAILAPFVTRPIEIVVDREKMGLPGPEASIQGVYLLRKADMSSKQYNGTLVLQESGVTNTFVRYVLPMIDKEGLNMNIYYVASAELFDLLPEERQKEIYPLERAIEAMGITGFTLPTMYRWILSPEGRKRTLHPFRKGHYLGSGKAEKVLEEADLHPEGQFKAILDYARYIEKNKSL